MEKMSFLFLIVIFLYLFVVFIRRNKTKVEKKIEYSEKKENQQKNLDDEKTVTAIVAAISCVMGKTPFVLKRVYMSGEVDEKKSAWRVAARSESTTKRNFFK